MELIAALNLNKHPKDCENLSLVSASGIKLANDQSCLTNEEGISYIKEIYESLAEHYVDVTYDIVGIIPCNNEIVIIVSSEKEYADIFRYIEKTKILHLVYDKYKYNKGDIKGAYTYNVEGSLIVSIAEDSSKQNIKTPLKVINLGNINDDSIANDLHLEDDNLSIAPTVKIPNIYNHSYLPGAAYKGWYYMFIRFKINTVDYTQWFGFGYPIYVDDIKPYQIMRYCYDQFINLQEPNNGLFARDGYADGYGVGCSDNFSDNSDIATETFKFNINTYDIQYNKYQIGLICSSKSYTKAYRTSDLNKATNSTFTFDIKQLIEVAATEFINENYNYFNVKNIINYNNRLYISNYEEQSLNNKDIVEQKDENGKSIIDNIKVKLRSTYYNIYDTYSSQIFGTDVGGSNTNQYEINNYDLIFNGGISFAKYFNVTDNTTYKLNYSVTTIVEGAPVVENKTITSSASNIIIQNRDNVYPSFVQLKVGQGLYDTIIKGTINYTNVETGATGVMRTDTMGIAGRINYIQPDNSFNLRKNYGTLLPGEVYNLFIHFIDKYGSVTNGYQLQNNDIREITKGDNSDIIPIEFTILDNDNKEIILYAICTSDSKMYDVFNADGPYFNVRFFKTITYDGNFKDEIIGEEYEDIKTKFITKFNSFATNNAIKDYTVGQVFNSGFSDGYSSLFGKHTNNNGDRLFKIPEDTSNGSSYVRYTIQLEDVTIPDGYIGYFISYEKFEPSKRVTGFLTRSDFRTQSKIISGNELREVDRSSNLYSSDKMFLYSSKYDISDSIKLDYNVINIVAKNNFEKREIQPYDYWQRNRYMKLPYDYNKPSVTKNNITREYYPMPEYKLCPADSIKDNRAGLGTALEIEDSFNLFTEKNFNPDDKIEHIDTYIAELYNVSNNLYMSKNKTLIKLGEIIYTNGSTTINNGYNGHFTYDGLLVYDSAGVSFNEADFIMRRLRGNNQRFYPDSTKDKGDHSYKANRPFVNYIQFGVYDDFMYESKSFKNNPANYVFPIKGINEQDANKKSYFPGNIVEPKNSIDLFQNKQTSQDEFNPKIYTNYREDLVNVSVFDKTIRRSNIIQDESRTNAWRVFPVEGYRNIAENKGIITNIIGIGTYLLIHTEHSLFMFNRDASLKTNDKDIQLSQPDAFDIDYTEVFTSDLGYGGMQDSLSYVVDQFGYIFYNENFKHLYRFDNGQLSIIDEDFYMWLEKYKPYNVRIANDKYNSRILIKFEFDVLLKDKETQEDKLEHKIEVFSYNYNTNKLISAHDYIFGRAYNTETKTYLLSHNNNGDYRNLFSFTRNKNYGFVHSNIINPNKQLKLRADGISNYSNSHLSIILNINYDTIKFIEYIKYKVRKVSNNHVYDYNYSPVEEQHTPYAGDLLRVFGEVCDTGEIDITVNSINEYNKYQKPYFELGNWNFNYLRDAINKYPDIRSANITRIYGNYIIIQFIFDNKDGELIEFEDVSPIISKQRVL